MADLESSRLRGDQHRPDGHPVLGHGHRWIRADQGIDRRALCPLVPVRCVLPVVSRHGRTWMLRLPWGWNKGELGPDEILRLRRPADPDPSELHNAEVEPICRKYLELRYRRCPTSTASYAKARKPGCRSCVRSGFIIATTLRRSLAESEFLFGPNILVCARDRPKVRSPTHLPTSRALVRLLVQSTGPWRPRNQAAVCGSFHHAALRLAGTILPLGPIKQYTSEEVNAPLTIQVYPGADGRFMVYEDDGISFAYRSGDWMGLDFRWDDKARRLSLELAEGSRMRPPLERSLEVRLMPDGKPRSVVFTGKKLDVTL